MNEVMYTSMLFKYNAGLTLAEGNAWFTDTGVYNNNLAVERYEPRGVAGCISPWNYPLAMAAFKMAPCLASGSTGVFKISELTPLASLKLA